MSWTVTSEGKQKYAVYSETLTTKQVGSGTANWSSVIDFVPPGTDFIIIANTAATNLSASTHVELFVSYDEGAALAARYRQNKTPFKPVTAAIDAATKVLFRDISAEGQFPYYWIKIPSGGGSVTLKVIVGAKLDSADA